MAQSREPRVLLLYPPTQTLPETLCKPNGSLAYPHLAGALLESGVEVLIYDACVGDKTDDLNEVFYKSTELPSGLFRTGVSDERILREVERFNIIGLTSIFTDQESMVLHTARLIKRAFPEKLIISGGVNARARRGHFLRNGVDIVCLSEADKTIQKIAEAVHRGKDFRHISAIAFSEGGAIFENPTRHEDVIWNLDELPMSAWHLLPNQRYWTIARPHGGYKKPQGEFRYGSMMTSMGCAFRCTYCHIAGEIEGSISGPIAKYRVKSDQRVLQELEVLKALGIKHVFLEDDMLFGYKERALRLLKKIQDSEVFISDVNGLNVIHMFRRVGLSKKFEPDERVISALVESGFKEIVLAFESATQRILKKYATNKWDPERHDIVALIKTIKDKNLLVGGNYMIGYPDETREEMNATIEMARIHKAAGLDWASFMAVIPLPGTPLFDDSMREGRISPDFNPDLMNWTKANFLNTDVPAAEIELMRTMAWEEMNDPELRRYKKDMTIPK